MQEMSLTMINIGVWILVGLAIGNVLSGRSK